MSKEEKQEIVRVSKGRMTKAERRVVEEYPLRLRVNDRDLATLICSPHQLNFLLAGFFRLQGFIDSLDDLLTMGVCQESGQVEVRIRGTLPERLQPTLTSGCGTGIIYNLPSELSAEPLPQNRNYTSASLFRLMKELNGRAEQYRSHGGIHSAAIGDETGRLLLYAEDIGRHNTLDRLAGEALFRNIELKGKILVSSGRMSSEMVAKAVRLGIGLIASRTSPTDKAVQLCEQAGITLVGYLRGRDFEVYSHWQHLQISDVAGRILGISGIILAGGESQRMGSDKSLLPIQGARFIDHVYSQMSELFEEVIIVTNSPELYHEIPCHKVSDIYPSQGALSGIHSGLVHAGNERVFVVACDMPYLSARVVRYLCDQAERGDVVIPKSSSGHEPLHALYGKNCLSAMERLLDAGQQRIMHFFDQVKVVEVPSDELKVFDPEEKSFKNINTPEDYYRLRGTQVGETESGHFGDKKRRGK